MNRTATTGTLLAVWVSIIITLVGIVIGVGISFKQVNKKLDILIEQQVESTQPKHITQDDIIFEGR